MDVKTRILALRLLAKLEADPEQAQRLGVRVSMVKMEKTPLRLGHSGANRNTHVAILTDIPEKGILKVGQVYGGIEWRKNRRYR